MLDEGPASADESDGDEQQRPLQTGRQNISQIPTGPTDSSPVGHPV